MSEKIKYALHRPSVCKCVSEWGEV